MNFSDSISEEISKIISNVLNLNGTFEKNTNLIELGVDSIAFIEIVVAIEERYGFEFDDFMLNHENFGTILKISEYVKTKIKG